MIFDERSHKNKLIIKTVRTVFLIIFCGNFLFWGYVWAIYKDFIEQEKNLSIGYILFGLFIFIFPFIIVLYAMFNKQSGCYYKEFKSLRELKNNKGKDNE